MPRVISLHTPEEAARWSLPALSYFDPNDVARHCVDEQLVLLNDHNRLAARCSLWWNHTPSLDGQRVGAVGHYCARDLECAQLLLEAACRRLAESGCTIAIGPMDGNTWRCYRWMTERGSEPTFFMEPDNSPRYPEHWRAAGFAPMAAYFSALNEDLAYEDAQVARGGERLARNGVTIRALSMDQFDDELRRIYAVSLRAFPGNFLYTPISEAEFLAQYLFVRERIRPELVLLAEHHGEPVGYVFTIPDWFRGPNPDTAIVKTVACLPGRAYAGLGTWLVALAQIAARNLGFRRVIHALMHESNNSLNLSARYARPFRRYTLYSRAL
jgi:hypothetical protein